MDKNTPKRTVIFSSALGLLPCRIIGASEGNYLVQVLRVGKPMTVPRSQVFELAEGYQLAEGGQLVGPEGVAPVVTCPAQGGISEEV